MNPAPPHTLLERLYQVFCDVSEPLNTCCGPGCSDCCTRNVTLTSLEAFLIKNFLKPEHVRPFLKILQKGMGEERFIPKTTINAISEACASGEEIPEESLVENSLPCLFLENGLCRIYPVRPFACRCMLSQFPCGEKGFASAEPFSISLSNVFQQYIEHLDQKGVTGNLYDILLMILDSSQTNLKVRNRPIKFLMIPPEHRERMKPVLEKINSCAN